MNFYGAHKLPTDLAVKPEATKERMILAALETLGTPGKWVTSESGKKKKERGRVNDIAF